MKFYLSFYFGEHIMRIKCGTLLTNMYHDTQDSSIFFIQLNYVHKNKVVPPYVNSLATRWHNTGNSTSSFSIQLHFWQQLFFYLLKSPLILDIHQLFLLDCVGLYL